jgi:hypothetical protein
MRGFLHLPAATFVIAAVAAPIAANDDSAVLNELRNELESLKAQVRAQQDEISELRKRLNGQQSQATRSVPPVLPATQGPALKKSSPVEGPLSVKIGGASLTPTGFVDFSQVWRSKTVTSGLPTNFAGIPFNNTVLGHRNQTLSSAANSRIGLQVNTRVLGADVLGVVETDFLGYVPNNAATSTNSYGLRLRLAFADVRKNRWEVLAGQNWSLLTPARIGIPATTDRLFLTQDLDPNIQSGLVWGRLPQLRTVFHATSNFAAAVSLES